LKSLKKDTPLGKIVYEAIKNDIVVYSAHTNLDVANGGINDILANLFDLQQVQVLKETYREKLNKIVVFVPRGYEDSVRSAMCNAGAGHIGNYSHCTLTLTASVPLCPCRHKSIYRGAKQIRKGRRDTY